MAAAFAQDFGEVCFAHRAAVFDADAKIRVDIDRTPAQPLKMNRAGFRRDYAAAFIHRNPVIQERQLLMADADAARIETRDGSLEGRSDNIVEPLQQQPFGKAKADSG
jgi:hypothetical protein